MSFTGNHRHKTRRERYEQSKRNIRIIFIFAMIFLVVLLFKNWVEVYDYIRLWFY